VRNSKAIVPVPPPQFVVRDEVRAALDDQSPSMGPSTGAGGVVLVSAPTGYGKTAAVADWIRASADVPTVWVSLDESDRDEARWWRSVLGALAQSPGVPQNCALHRLRWPPAGEPWAREVFVAAVLEAIEGLPAPVRLVLDDVHEIVGHPAERALRALARHPVHGLTLVLCSRVDPPIGLDRLRLDRRLGQLRVDKLAFSVPDAQRLFALTSVELSREQAVTLVERTEGWVAALRLVALSLQGAPDRSAMVAEFAGDDRSVADYLVDEVLSTLDERELRVIEAACSCSPIAVELACALTEDPGAAEVLERLEATTALIRAVDRRGQYYEAHELLRSHVLARLRRTGGDHLNGVYRRASAWFDSRHDAAEAVRFAVLAGDVSGTAALLRAQALELLAAGAVASLRSADELLRCHGLEARTRMILGLAALEYGDVDHAAALLEDVPLEDGAPAPQDPWRCCEPRPTRHGDLGVRPRAQRA
jgi:LuxR family maltose regulon positive regulatory protein